MRAMSVRDSRTPLSSVVARALNEIATLMRTELRLARVEVVEKIGSIANGGMMIGVGLVLVMAALMVILLAIVEWLVVAGLPREWSLLLIGIVAAVIGIVFALRGLRRIKELPIVPERTMEQLKADMGIVKEQVQ
jgi:uncharacterized membrane protein YqjE